MKWKAIVTVLALTSLSINGALAVTVTGLRANDTTNRSRLVLDLSAKPEGWTTSYDEANHEVTVSLPKSSNQIQEGHLNGGKEKGVLKGIAIEEKDPLKFIFQADTPVQYHAFALENPNRIVVDMFAAISNKTSKNLDSSLSLIKWNTTGQEGPVQVTALTAPAGVAMKVYSNQAGNDVAEVSSVNRAAVGLKQKGKYIPVSVTDTAGQGIVPDSLTKTAQLVYGAGRGYTINSQKISLQVSAGKWTLPVTGINQARMANDLILYTDIFGSSTGTNAFGREVTVINGKVTALAKANSPLTKGAMVLSGHGTSADKLKTLKVGDSLAIRTAPALAKVSTEGAITYAKGSPLLVSGAYVGPKSNSRLARTFIGTTKNRGLIAMAVDQDGKTSMGVTSKEGANLIKQLGAIDALELNGQGAADMAYKGKVIHQDQNQEKNYEDILVLK